MTAALRARFEQHASEHGARSPLYAEICRAVAGDDDTLSLMLHAPEHQRRPTLLQAAIHDLLLAGAAHELAAHVPTVAGGRAGPRAGARAAAPLALDFCREHRAELARALATRSTQTNEVNRAAVLLPALVHAVPRGGGVRLVELGASAGLNLLLDRFSYRYGGSAAVPGGRVTCDCAVRGELPPLYPLPLIAERIGVDLEPVDLRDAAARRWLLACVWPDEPERVARLRAAIVLARREPPTVVRGDGRALLAELVGSASDVHAVIWHSWVLAYWSESEQRALAGAIDELGADRDLTWVYLEQPSETPGLPTPVVAGARHEPGDAALVVASYRHGKRTIARLADAHGHLHHMRWLTTSRGVPGPAPRCAVPT